MKTCPVCRSICFDDMDMCYGCMHRFEDDEAKDGETPQGQGSPTQPIAPTMRRKSREEPSGDVPREASAQEASADASPQGAPAQEPLARFAWGEPAFELVISVRPARPAAEADHPLLSRVLPVS